jgi:iron complex transport system ATP-binding protein
VTGVGGPLLKIETLGVAFGRRRVLQGVSLAVRPGELVVVIGPNGAGKSTLLRACAGLMSADGEVHVGGESIRRLAPSERARRVSYLPQGQEFYWPLAVRDVVGLGRLPRAAGASLSAADSAAVTAAMVATGVAVHADRAVTTLSGGERARVAIARVLATEAPVILADEPTAALDPRYQLIVLNLLRRHAESGGAVVVALHDIGLAARLATRVVVLDHGRLVADGRPRDVLTAARMAETFGVSVEIVTLRDSTVVVPWSVTDEQP